MAAAPDLDPTDREVVALLEQDSRRTLADIGRRVALSPPAVKRRIDRLERLGVIRGWTVRVDRTKLGLPLQAFAELRFSGSTSVEEIQHSIDELPEVEAIFTTAGDLDALVWMRVADVADLKRVVDELRRSGRVTGTKTLLVLDAWSRHDPV